MPITRTRLMVAEEAAWYLNTSSDWVQRAAAAGKLPAVRVGRQLRFRDSDLDAYIAAHTTGVLVAS